MYFNVIAHNARQGVREFIVAVVGAPGGDAPQAKINLERKFSDFIAALRDSNYISTIDGSAGPAAPLAEPTAMKQFFDDLNWGSLDVFFQTIEEADLRDFLAEQRRLGAAFDVTACRNKELAGAVAWLVSRGGSPIHSFELRKRMTHTETDLLPYLKSSDYAYPDLSSSRLIRSATRRVNLGTIHKTWFWVISVVVAVIVGGLTIWLPEQIATPVFAAAATFATIMSAVGLLVRYPD
ncbi:hypothetical protein [Microbacterium paraoxydans]|uniref:Uncharacterized protein n=1 Tax=Microbacterium paraoxydans TaxID=199592 RepID=A0ABS5INQ7_9MICO|nr:hypothetical protein [Microbacterium paraoxydans]MBS0024490.1 hypothetical protein [Microbacterium paraoxydans]